MFPQFFPLACPHMTFVLLLGLLLIMALAVIRVTRGKFPKLRVASLLHRWWSLVALLVRLVIPRSLIIRGFWQASLLASLLWSLVLRRFLLLQKSARVGTSGLLRHRFRRARTFRVTILCQILLILGRVLRVLLRVSLVGALKLPLRLSALLILRRLTSMFRRPVRLCLSPRMVRHRRLLRVVGSRLLVHLLVALVGRLLLLRPLSRPLLLSTRLITGLPFRPVFSNSRSRTQFIVAGVLFLLLPWCGTLLSPFSLRPPASRRRRRVALLLLLIPKTLLKSAYKCSNKTDATLIGTF